MWMLFGTVLTTSFFDSLNPSAIAQQMLLQAMVKNRRHIWYFIFGIGAANLALGLAVYYGIATWVSKLLSEAENAYPYYVYGAALLAGAVCLLAGVRFTVRAGRDSRNGADGEEDVKKPARLSPLSLFLLGVASCGVELTSAFPYFGFLAVLTGYNLMFPLVLLFVLIYDFVYVLPLILLYFGYGKLQGTAVIRRIEAVLGRVASYVVPVVVTLAGALLICYGLYNLI